MRSAHMAMLPVIAFTLLSELGSAPLQTSRRNRGQWAAGFSAEFTYTKLAKLPEICSGRVYANILAQPRGLRQDVIYPNNREINSIWRQDRETSVSIDRARGVFWETPRTSNGGLRSANTSGPSATPTFMGELISSRRVGAELIEGRSTEHWKVTTRDSTGTEAVWDYWEDERLHVCVRALLPGRRRYVLKNIIEARQPASLFTVPSGFREIREPESLPKLY